MAIFHMDINPIKRSRGQQATGAAAYRAGEIIRDDRTGDLHNHSRRQDVRHTEIFLPSRFGETTMAWARNRVSLWNAAEAAEKRRDARVAREYQVALPPELTPSQRLALARSFSRELADRYGVAVDLAVHDPKRGESQNFHAHLLTTTREVTPTGLGQKTGLDMGAVPRAKLGLASHSEEYFALRERWAVLTNQTLREANVDARVDHRSLAAQGIDRQPLLRIPMEFYQLERRGMPKEAAERLREDYRSRLAAHLLERSAGSARIERADLQPEHAVPQLERPAPQSERAPLQHQRVAQQPERTSAKPKQEVVTPRNTEEIRRRAVQAWLQMRSKEVESDAGQDMAHGATRARGNGQER
jgi:ATP-dependent exoDNAse (exonuclease V) alpha subunit